MPRLATRRLPFERDQQHPSHDPQDRGSTRSGAMIEFASNATGLPGLQIRSVTGPISWSLHRDERDQRRRNDVSITDQCVLHGRRLHRVPGPPEPAVAISTSNQCRSLQPDLLDRAAPRHRDPPSRNRADRWGVGPVRRGQRRHVAVGDRGQCPDHDRRGVCPAPGRGQQPELRDGRFQRCPAAGRNGETLEPQRPGFDRGLAGARKRPCDRAWPGS